MKKFYIGVLVLVVILLSGCGSKFKGTWCRYVEVPSSLVVLKAEVSEEEYQKILQYIGTITNLRSYDIVNDIEDATTLVNIYYMNEENIANYENDFRSLSGVSKVENKRISVVEDKLTINDKNYIFDTSLNSLAASEVKGNYNIKDDLLTLEGGTKFYFKNKFLCYDDACNKFLTKSIGATCKD